MPSYVVVADCSCFIGAGELRAGGIQSAGHWIPSLTGFESWPCQRRTTSLHHLMHSQPAARADSDPDNRGSPTETSRPDRHLARVHHLICIKIHTNDRKAKQGPFCQAYQSDHSAQTPHTCGASSDGLSWAIHTEHGPNYHTRVEGQCLGVWKTPRRCHPAHTYLIPHRHGDDCPQSGRHRRACVKNMASRAWKKENIYTTLVIASTVPRCWAANSYPPHPGTLSFHSSTII